MPIRIENVVFLFGKDSVVIEISGNKNIIKNNKYYDYSIIKRTIAKNPIRRMVRYIGIAFRGIADICFGIESGYKLCCIKAFLIGKKYRIDELHQILCYKCYKKMLRLRNNG